MNREIHVRFWESAGVRFPCATQPFIHFIDVPLALAQRATSLSTSKRTYRGTALGSHLTFVHFPVCNMAILFQ